MTEQFVHFQKLDAYAVAKAMAMAMHGAKISHRELRDQAERASVPPSFSSSEGLPNDAPGMHRRYFYARSRLTASARWWQPIELWRSRWEPSRRGARGGA